MFVLPIFTIITYFKAFLAVHKLSIYMIIARCTVNYLLFMLNNWIFNEKYKTVTYSNVSRSRLNLSHDSTYVKLSLKAHLKQPLWNTFTVYSFIFSQMSIEWRLRFQILEGMTHHPEVEVTWELHKTPWRSGLSLGEKGSPWG